MTPREVREMIDRQIAALGEGGKARLRASQAVDKLFMGAQVELGSIKTLKQRERERAAEKLYVAYWSLDEFLEPFRESESVTAEIFDQLQRIIMATHDQGTTRQMAAPRVRRGPNDPRLNPIILPWPS